MSDVTSVNTSINSGNSTVINSEAASIGSVATNNATSINAEIVANESVKVGDLLCKKYKVEERMDVSTGEADLYICSYGGNKYIAKVYRRKMAVKNEIIDKLLNITSPNVAKVIEADEKNGFPVVVIPYYKNGSLQGKRYSYDQIRKVIVPNLNEGLKVLHDNGIVHKDLKPSNIMLNDAKNGVAIIDFGISSVHEANSTVIVTQTGMTPQYSAPETFNNVFLDESDYYSLGITIYELFTGTTPYGGMETDEILKYSSVQKIPFPNNMPEDLQNLITALTYRDVTNRKDKSNPNRRWGYEEVKKWCAGEKQVIPGKGSGFANAQVHIQPYTFRGKAYDNKSDLVNALALEWVDGKKQLFRGLLSGFFKVVDPEVAGYCLDAEEEAATSRENDDIIFFKTLYKIDPSTTAFYWKGEVYENLTEFGKELLYRLWDDGSLLDRYYGSLLENRALTMYADMVGVTDDNVKNVLKGIESNYSALGDSENNRIRLYYLMAYLLSGEKVLSVSGQKLSSIEEMSSYMTDLLKNSYDTFEGFCKSLVNERGELNPQLESWLLSLGKQNEIARWREELR